MLQKLQSRRGGFTLVEIMIVVAIIALLAAIAVPNFLRARKRTQATQTLEDLRMLDSALDQYAIENNKQAGNAANFADLQGYIKSGSRLYTGGGAVYQSAYSVDSLPRVPASAWSSYSDVAPSTFWAPYSVN